MSKTETHTLAGILKKLKALEPQSDEQRNQIICALIGHSNIITGCFGYIYCARCGAQTGDSLGSVYRNDNAVLAGHNCDTCKANFEKLTWEDKLYVRNPFFDDDGFDAYEKQPYLLTGESDE